MRTLIRPTLVSFLALTLLTGLVYPAFVTGFANVAFPFQARGTVVETRGSARGSALIGQGFTDPKFFWSRPSATGPTPYNGAASSGSNLGPTNPVLAAAVQQRVAALRAADSGNTAPVPIDLVTASGSGLDPHLSPAAAEYQVGRVARLRGLAPDSVRALVRRFTQGRQFGLLGDPVVAILPLNLALEGLIVTP